MTRQSTVWLNWILANIVGVAIGWLLSDAFLPVNAILSFLAFEVCVWSLRLFSLRRIQERPRWQLIDTFVWFIYDMVGVSLGSQLDISSGRAFGLIIGVTFWVGMLTIQQSRGVLHESILVTVLRGLWSFVFATLIGSLVLVILMELEQKLGGPNLWIIHALIGATLGGIIGFVTGWVFIKFQRWQILES